LASKVKPTRSDIYARTTIELFGGRICVGFSTLRAVIGGVILLVALALIVTATSPARPTRASFDGSTDTLIALAMRDLSAQIAAGGLPNTEATAPEPERPAVAEQPESDPSNAFSSFYYYDKARLERYRSFSEANPEFEAGDVVWMVDCDLDKAPYEDSQEVADPSSLQALVNKHFTLPFDYAPSDLVDCGSAQLRAEAAEAIAQLIAGADSESLRIWTSSGFRSYGAQDALYQGYAAENGEAVADAFSARAGSSEHQTGLAVDVNATDWILEVAPAEANWLAGHAHEYGFIVRYTTENSAATGYTEEPWHLRYVGVSDAMNMHKLSIASYEEYWVKHILYSPPPSS
jgi:D-alanyl-D-alanine carboxypeptidase